MHNHTNLIKYWYYIFFPAFYCGMHSSLYFVSTLQTVFVLISKWQRVKAQRKHCVVQKYWHRMGKQELLKGWQPDIHLNNDYEKNTL